MKLRIKAIMSLAAAFVASGGYALDITTTEAGTLASELSDGMTFTTLKVNGPINASDISYINTELKDLNSLDLSDATIMAQSGVKNDVGYSEFKADELPSYAFFGSKMTTITLPSNLATIGEGAFGNSSITALNIPASVRTIGNYAMVNCDKLTEITVPSTVTEIGSGVWKDCSALEKAVIYTTLESVGDNLFDGCPKLSELQLQPTIKSIGESAFANCTSLDEFTFPASLVSIGDKTFYNSGLVSVHLDNCGSLASIGDFAFAECANLESVTIGNQTMALGKGLFFNDTALQHVQLPSSTTVIPAFTFKGTKSINPENALPGATQEIGDYALYGWENATSLILPEGTSHIGTGAMEGWSSLEKLGAENLSAVPSLGSDVWAGIKQGDVYLYVNGDQADNFKAADQWKDFNITIGTTAVDDILDDATGANNGTNVDFTVGDGYLKIASKGSDIARINIYDLNGRSRYTAGVDGMSAVINTQPWRGSVLIVDVQLEDGTRATVKLSL